MIETFIQILQRSNYDKREWIIIESFVSITILKKQEVKNSPKSSYSPPAYLSEDTTTSITLQMFIKFSRVANVSRFSFALRFR